MKKSNDNKQFISILNAIYLELFEKMQQGIADIFLCGGASTKKEKSTRDRLKDKLEKTSSFRVLYPEDLFMDILNLNKSHNLLALEQMLAQNCDCICIVCESVGSYVELGAFTNNSDTFSKVVALVQRKYKNEKSFIMLGPIKYIKSRNKENVIYYNSNITETVSELIHTLRKFISTPKKDLNTIVGLHYYILLVLYFFRDIEINELVNALKIIMNRNKLTVDDANFDIIFRSAMKLLYKESSVERYSNDEIEYYCLTDRGLRDCQKLISKIKIRRNPYLCDKIRLQVLKCAYY